MTEKTIPLLPCRTELIQSVVDFYTALGFETTHLQKSPYAYAVVQRGAVELQLYGMKDHAPATSHSSRYVLTEDVDGLHAALRSGLKAAYGHIPTRALKPEDEQPTPVQRVQLLVLRGDIAQRLGDEEGARGWLEEAATVRLGAEERETAHDALARLSDLRR